MDEPVPIRRAIAGFVILALLGVAAIALVRPAISLFVPPADDSAIVLGPSTMTANGPVEREVILGEARGWDGERDAGGGRVRLDLIVAPSRFGGVAVVAATGPIGEDCALETGGDRLLDCEGRAWTFEGSPLDPSDPPLDRFGATVDDGTITADLTQTIDD